MTVQPTPHAARNTPAVASPAARPEIVVIAGSTGGFEAMREIFRALPRDLPVPVVVLLHRTGNPDTLASSLALVSGANTKNAVEGEGLLPGTVYVAPSGMHVRIRPDHTISLFDGRTIRFQRSSANPLFESAARVYGSGVIAVVLSGFDRDGTDGVQAVNRAGGTVIAQSPATSRPAGMPSSAITTGCVNHIVPLERIAPTLVNLLQPRPRSTTQEPFNPVH
jgi:two-component system chemotaxis response regulator CheB